MVTSTDDPNDLREKITIKDIPLSVDNALIEDYLQGNYPELDLVTDVRYSKERNEDGELTDYRNGDRHIYAKAPVLPILPEKVKIGDFSARVSHPTQRNTCRICHQQGHKAKSENCLAYDPDLNVKPFRSEEMVESNFYPCMLHIDGVEYHSSEQAFQHRRAIDVAYFDVAEKIMEAPDARIAKKEANKIPQEVRDEWDQTKGEKEMLMLIREKAKQVPVFYRSLIDSDTTYAEATLDKYWACEQAKCTKPEFWPGKNILGAMLQLRLRDLVTNPSTEIQIVKLEVMKKMLKMKKI